MDLQLCCHAKLPSDGINVHLASLNHTQKQYETDQNTDKLNVNKIWTVEHLYANCEQELNMNDFFANWPSIVYLFQNQLLSVAAPISTSLMKNFRN
jgi:hypothetical protein